MGKATWGRGTGVASSRQREALESGWDSWPARPCPSRGLVGLGTRVSRAFFGPPMDGPDLHAVVDFEILNLNGLLHVV